MLYRNHRIQTWAERKDAFGWRVLSHDGASHINSGFALSFADAIRQAKLVVNAMLDDESCTMCMGTSTPPCHERFCPAYKG